MYGRECEQRTHDTPHPRLGPGMYHPPQPPAVMRIPQMQTEAYRTSAKLGSQHHRQANYTTPRQIGGCPSQPRRSCDSPSAARAGPVASPRQTGLPSPATIETPLIISDWAKWKIAQHTKAKKSRSENPPSEGASRKIGVSGFGAETCAQRVKNQNQVKRKCMSDHGSRQKFAGAERTVIAPEYEPVQSVETEEVEEIPRE